MSESEKVVLTQEVVDTPKKKRVKRPKSKARKIIEWVLFSIFIVIFGFALVAQIDSMVHAKEHYNQPLRFGVGSFIVRTNSMEPEYKVDTAIITYKENAWDIANNFKAGQTIDLTFVNIKVQTDFKPTDTEKYYEPITTGKVMTHRLIEVFQDPESKIYYFATAGINPDVPSNLKGQYQIFSEKELLGVVKVNSPFLGAIFKAVSSEIGLLVLLLLPALYLIITSTIDIFKTLKESEDKEITSGSSSGGVEIEGLSNKDKERLKRELLEEMMKGKKGEDK